MSIEQQQAIATEVLDALESGSLELPTLPDMAIKIRAMIDDPNVSADKIVQQLATDPSISAQIIKAANSAAFSTGNPISDLRTAISRLGYRMLHNIVMTITMGQLFKASSPMINQEMKRLWDHSREVAVNSYVLASQLKHLKLDQAMLAGLLHDLGNLPLCMYADRHHPRIDQETLDGLMRKFNTQIGAKLLTSWNFPPDIVEVIAQHENLQRMTDNGVADYTDVVTVANLLMPSTEKFVKWENVSALGRLRKDPADCRNFHMIYAEQLSAANEMLGFSTSKSPPR